MSWRATCHRCDVMCHERVVCVTEGYICHGRLHVCDKRATCDKSATCYKSTACVFRGLHMPYRAICVKETHMC